MGCPDQVIIGDNLTFGICTHDPDTGVLTDAAAAPAYRVYEDMNTAVILNGTMTLKVDDGGAGNTTGFYTALLACTAANGFEDGKNYNIYIEATVDGDQGGISYTFKAVTHTWDEVLTAATHNVATSSGRRLRQLQDSGLYDGGAIWVDTNNGTAGSVDYENGTVNNPVDNWADALLLADQLNFSRFQIVNGSSITLSDTSDNFSLLGMGWTLALGGRSIEGLFCEGASVTGIGTATVTPPRFEKCGIGAVTMPPCVLRWCGIGASSGQFTAGSAGQYFIVDCVSMAPGSAQPVLVFTGNGVSTGINVRRWSGGADYTLDSDCTLSHEVVTGGGTTVITGGADVEIRGITRSLDITMSAAEDVQFCGTTGLIALSGTTTGNANLYGVAATVTDTRSTKNGADETVSHDRLQAYTQLTLRSDASITTDRATFLSEINANEGTGAGSYDKNDSQQSNQLSTESILSQLVSIALKLTGITYLKNWLALIMGKTADAATLAEVNATTAGTNYSNVTESLEATGDALATVDALLDKIAVPIIGTISTAGEGTEIYVHGGVTLTATVDSSGNRSAMVFS